MSGQRKLATCLLGSAAAFLGAASSPAISPAALNAALASHVTRPQNAERQLYGLPALSWDQGLAAEAAGYAAELASTGKWAHSPPERRVGEGENLWMGTRGAFTPEEMVAGWISEKSLFHPGTFPNVSSSGSWHEVGHYTQIIWPDTVRVGCAVRSSASYDYLVCRYKNPGNVIGERLLS